MLLISQFHNDHFKRNVSVSLLLFVCLGSSSSDGDKYQNPRRISRLESCARISHEKVCNYIQSERACLIILFGNVAFESTAKFSKRLRNLDKLTKKWRYPWPNWLEFHATPPNCGEHSTTRNRSPFYYSRYSFIG